MPQHVLSGGLQHDFASTARAPADWLAHAEIDSTISEDLGEASPRISHGDFDRVTPHALRWQMAQHEKYAPQCARWAYGVPAAGRTALTRHRKRAGGLSGLHTAALCFDTWNGRGEMFGARWRHSFHPETVPAHVAPRYAHARLLRRRAAWCRARFDAVLLAL